jgi:hypothetical protein
MTTIRMFAFVAAVLITAFLLRVITYGNYDLIASPHAATAASVQSTAH